MKTALLNVLTALALVGQGSCTPAASLDKRYLQEDGGIKYKVFEHAATGSKTKIVSNSGICETTPGVNQHSGYFSVGKCSIEYSYFLSNRGHDQAPT